MLPNESIESDAGVELTGDLEHMQSQPEGLCREFEPPDLRLDIGCGCVWVD